MRRLLLIFLVAVGLLWWLRRLLRSALRSPSAASPDSAQHPLEAAMVRDRICDTFLPKSRALVERDAAGEHYFCSEGCRQRHLAAGRGVAAPRASR